MNLILNRSIYGLKRHAVFRMSSTLSSATTSSLLDTNAGSRFQTEHAFSVAPMMEYTDCHQRKLFRYLSQKAVLYTEMVTANALVRTEEPIRFLEADFTKEDPVVMQLGGSDPTMMADAARIAKQYGYSEFNINCGCPSDKVAGAGCFGAKLMLNPDLVSELALSISEITDKPTSIKCRIGVNDNDSYDELYNFIDIISKRALVNHFIIHARKAILNAKFSPEDNRKIPKLKYEYVYRLIEDFPHIAFTINGGITTMEESIYHLQGEAQREYFDKDRTTTKNLDNLHSMAGVMVGRACVDKPWHWSTIDSQLYNLPNQNIHRLQILDEYSNYAQHVVDAQGPKARRSLVKPLLGLFSSEPRGKLFRKKLDENLLDSSMSMKDIIMSASKVLSDRTLLQLPEERLLLEQQKIQIEEANRDGNRERRKIVDTSFVAAGSLITPSKSSSQPTDDVSSDVGLNREDSYQFLSMSMSLQEREQISKKPSIE